MAEPPDLIGPVHLPIATSAGIASFRLWYGDFEDCGRWVVAATGDLGGDERVPVRIESACVFGHVFGSAKCDCGFQLRAALGRMVAEARGVVVYALDQDARGLGVEAHFRIYMLRQQEELDTDAVYERLAAPVDARDYAPVAPLLRAIGVNRIRLLSNNLSRLALLREAGFDVDREPLQAPLDRHNMGTLMLEQEDLGYATGLTTHSDWLRPLQEAVAADPDYAAALVVVDGEEAARCYDRRWNVARRTVERLGGRGPAGGTTVAYVTDLPRRDEVAVWAHAGVDVLVVPFANLPAWLRDAGARANVHVQDWARSNAYREERPQWDLVSSIEIVDVYARGDLLRGVLTCPGKTKRISSAFMRRYARGDGESVRVLDEDPGPMPWVEVAVSGATAGTPPGAVRRGPHAGEPFEEGRAG